METMLVAGGAGFIGCNFVRLALARTEARLVVVDKLTYAGSLHNLEGLAGQPRCRFLQGDIGDGDFVRRLFEDHRPTWTVNFAAETHVDRSIDDPRPFLTTNVAGTAELLEGARTHYRRLEGSARGRFRYLQVSSDEVYGSAEGESTFSEATACAPNSPYAASKAAADHWVRACHRTYGLPTLTTRCSNNYGPYQFPEKLIPLMVLNAMEARPLPIYGDGGNVRDWLHVEDHCAALLLVLQGGRPGESYNVGGGNERTNLEMVDQVCACLEALLPAAANPAMQRRGVSTYADLKRRVPDRPGHDRRYAVDSGKIRGELGWAPRYDLAEGLAQTVRWYAENGEWCRKVQEDNYDRRRLGTAGRTGS